MVSGSLILPKEGNDHAPLAPPDSLTGVQTAAKEENPSAPSGISCGVDWISWTDKQAVKPDDVCSLVGIPVGEWVLGSGASNYRDGLRSGPYTVLFNGTQEGMGVHLRVSGEGCRDWRGREGFQWEDMLRFLADRGSFSRVDVAFDIRDGSFPLDRFYGDLAAGNLTTRWKQWSVTRDFTLQRDSVATTGSVARFGSRSSSSYCRVYDKGAEVGGASGQWVRVELETKSDRTAPLLDRVLQRGLQSVAGVLNGLLTIREPGTGERYRWPVAEYWQTFIGSAERCRLTLDKPRRSAGEVAAWIEHSCSASLAMLYRHYDYGPEFLEKVAQEGQRRMKQRHWDMVKEVN